jgi:GTP 3',8-cyclase
MIDDLRVDSHKLIFHVERVAAWQAGKPVCPIYMEIAPSGGCNHRCIFCALDYLKYKPVFLDAAVLIRRVQEAGRLGVKSIMYAGEGEPLLHPQIADIIQATKKAGIDVSVTTNGSLLEKSLSEKILKYLSWIRISFNAGTASTYAAVHRCGLEYFDKVLANLKEAVRVKRKQKLKTTLGLQCLLIPQNTKEILLLAEKIKKIGFDYLAIKPYSQHPLSGSHIDKRFKYIQHLDLGDALRKMESRSFKIIFRDQTMQRLSVAKEYRACLGLPFWAYISARGHVYACSSFLGKKEFYCGDIYRENFKDIIFGPRRLAILKRAATCMDIRRCRLACRLDKINSYLWELKHPGEHVNFI